MSTHHAPAPDRRGRPPASDQRGSDRYRYGARGHGGDAYDDDWDDELYADPPVSRILWGRVAVLAAALLAAFLVGRLTAGPDDAAMAELQQRIDELTTDLDQARAELDAVRAGGTSGPAEDAEQNADDTQEQAGDDEAAGASGESDSAEAEDAEADGSAAAEEPAVEGERYTVQSGDHLYGLAERFYDDGQQWRLIAEANNLPPGAVLAEGQEIIIPPAD